LRRALTQALADVAAAVGDYRPAAMVAADASAEDFA
jgi:hypothetical protein